MSDIPTSEQRGINRVALAVVGISGAVGVALYGTQTSQPVARALGIGGLWDTQFGAAMGLTLLLILIGFALTGWLWLIAARGVGASERVENNPERAIGEAIRKTRGTPGLVGVLRISINRSRELAQIFGKDRSNRILDAIRVHVQALATEADSFVKMSEEDFLLARPLVASVEDLESFAELLLRALIEPVQVDSLEIPIAASVGVSYGSADGSLPAELLERAERAVYQAQQQGFNRIEVCSEGQTEGLAPSEIVTWLNDAFEHRNLRVHYQPIVRSDRGELIGVEALLRWEHPVRGILPPELVLPALEDSGLILEVGRWILQEVCHQAREWNDRFPNEPRLMVFVNLSAVQLTEVGLVESIEHAVEVSGCHADQIVLELPAIGSAHIGSQIWGVLREAKAIGLRLSVDNFGDDNASFGTLRRLRVDYLKLDRSLMRARGVSAVDDAVTAAVVSLGHGLGIQLIASGVESQESVERARYFGCEFAQGFRFGAAEPAPVISEMILEQQLSKNSIISR